MEEESVKQQSLTRSVIPRRHDKHDLCARAVPAGATRKLECVEPPIQRVRVLHCHVNVLRLGRWCFTAAADGGTLRAGAGTPTFVNGDAAQQPPRTRLAS